MMHTDGITIQKFEQRHLGGVCEIEKICFARPWSKEDLASQLELNTSHFAVACDGEIVVGYMGLQIFSREGYVTNIAVLPQYRRRGIAKALLEYQMKNDMKFVTLEVRKSNAAARALYELFGFENKGVRLGFYTDPDEDAVIMTKYTENNQ